MFSPIASKTATAVSAILGPRGQDRSHHGGNQRFHALPLVDQAGPELGPRPGHEVRRLPQGLPGLVLRAAGAQGHLPWLRQAQPHGPADRQQKARRAAREGLPPPLRHPLPDPPHDDRRRLHEERPRGWRSEWVVRVQASGPVPVHRRQRDRQLVQPRVRLGGGHQPRREPLRRLRHEPRPAGPVLPRSLAAPAGHGHGAGAQGVRVGRLGLGWKLVGQHEGLHALLVQRSLTAWAPSLRAVHWTVIGTTFVTLTVIMDPVGVAPIFIACTAPLSNRERQRTALRAVIAAGALIIGFAFFGGAVLDYLDVSVDSLSIAGGLLL